MFAVIKSGGKQYRVAADENLKVERLPGEPGDSIVFDSVLMLGGEGTATVGAPFVDGASVAAEIVEQGRGRKIVVFKKRRRKNSRRKNGHRQYYTLVKITDILTDGRKPPAKKKAAAKKPETDDKPPAKEESAKPAPAAAVEPSAKAAAEDTVAPLFDVPAGEPDDLKKISGVGPVLEKKLHALGVTHFEQIANFTEDDIAKVDDALNFKGRITRDGWVDQARALAEEAKKES